MKSKEEIERLARIYENYNPNDCEIAQAESGGCYHGYKKGYTQCQEDMVDTIKKAIEFGYELRNNHKPINSGIDWVKEFSSLSKQL